MQSISEENTDAIQCGIRTDQLWQEFNKTISVVEAIMVDTLIVKQIVDRNKKEMVSGEITQKYPGTQTPLQKRDLEIQNMMHNRKIKDNLRDLYPSITRLWRFCDVKRIDRKVFFTKEDFARKVEGIKEELKKSGIFLYEERK